MCYTGSCQYEIPAGCDGQGDCSLYRKEIPPDALCIKTEKEIKETFKPTLEELEEYHTMQQEKCNACANFFDANNCSICDGFKFYKEH